MRRVFASIIAAALIGLSPGGGCYQALAGGVLGRAPLKGASPSAPGIPRVDIVFPDCETPVSGLEVGEPMVTPADITAQGPYREIRLQPLKAISEHAAEQSFGRRLLSWPGRFLASLVPNLSEAPSFKRFSYLPYRNSWADPRARPENGAQEWRRWFESQIDRKTAAEEDPFGVVNSAQQGPVRLRVPLLKAPVPGAVSHARAMPRFPFSLDKPADEKELTVLLVHGASEEEARRNLGHVLRGLQVVVRQGFRERWEEYVLGLQKLSLVPFVPLIIPQAWKNSLNLNSGHPENLNILKKWIGWPSGSLADMGMVMFFEKMGESHRYAMMVQIFGIIMSSVVLTQIWWAAHVAPMVFAGHAVPTGFLVAQLSFVGVGLSIVALDALGRLPEKAWNLWNDIVGVLQQAFLPVAVWLTFADSVPLAAMLIPSALAAALVILYRKGFLSRYKAIDDFMYYFTAWNSTALFAVGPICQLIINSMHPAQIAAGLSPETFVLNIIGNGLMLAMAILQKNGIWFVGSSFAVHGGGLAQLFQMYYFDALSPLYFLIAAGAVWLYLRFILKQSQRYFGDSSILGPLMRLKFRREQKK